MMKYDVTPDLFVRIANARLVELKIGTTECLMTGEQQAALGALARWTTREGFEQSRADAKRDAIKLINTAGERFPNLLTLVHALERVRNECPGLWPDQVDDVLGQVPPGDTVAALFHVDQPTPGVIVATETQIMQVLAMEPMLISTVITYSQLESIQFREYDRTFAILAFGGHVDGEDCSVAAVVGEDAMRDAKRLTQFVARATGIRPT